MWICHFEFLPVYLWYRLLNMELVVQKGNAYVILSTPAKSLFTGTESWSFPPVSPAGGRLSPASFPMCGQAFGFSLIWWKMASQFQWAILLLRARLSFFSWVCHLCFFPKNWFSYLLPIFLSGHTVIFKDENCFHSLLSLLHLECEEMAESRG